MPRWSLLLLAAVWGVTVANDFPQPYAGGGASVDYVFKLWDATGAPLIGASDDGDDLQLDVGCDGSASASTNDYTEVGGGDYKVVLTTTELTTPVLCGLIDQDSSNEVDGSQYDDSFVIYTFGHTSAHFKTLGWNTGDAYSAVGSLNDPSVQEIWDHIIDGTLDAEEMLCYLNAALANKSDFDDVDTVTFRNASDTGDMLVVVTANGDRTSVSRSACGT